MGIENNNNPLKKKKELFLIATCMVWPFFFSWVFIPTHRTAFFFFTVFFVAPFMYALSLFFLMQFGTLLFHRRSCFFSFSATFTQQQGFRIRVSTFFLSYSFVFVAVRVCGSRFFFFFSSKQSFCSFCFSPPALMPLLKTAYKWLAMSFLFFGRQSLLKLFKQPRTCGNNYLSFLCGVFFFFLFFFPLSHRVLFSAIQ